MAMWRRLALAFFPKERRWFQAADCNYYQLYFDLLPMCRKAHAVNDQLTLRKIYAHAEWCLRQKERAPDLNNAVWVCFYEHLFDHREDWERVIPYLSARVYESCWPIWEYRWKFWTERFGAEETGRLRQLLTASEARAQGTERKTMTAEQQIDLEQWLGTAADLEEAAALTAYLVAIRSFPGEEGEVQRAVADWFTAQGLAPELSPTSGEHPNIIVRVENGPGPTLLLNGHTDTVLEAQGWTCDPWQGRRDGDRLYGLGAADMKSGVAAAMLVTRALARAPGRWSGTVIFTAVMDEEAFSIGARALVDLGIRADYCVVTEPMHEPPMIGGVGKVLVRGEVTGKSSHASMPDQGINAAEEAARLIAQLAAMPLGQHPRMSSSQAVLSLHSGNAQYVITVPERATFTINRHTVPGETAETILAEMRALADALDSPATFAFAIDPPYYPAWELDADNPFAAHFARAYAAEIGHAPTWGYARHVADANYFAADLGIPTLQFGPHGYGFHQCDEWVDLPSIATTIRVILRLATDILR
jgi:acetylornithine deacetylase/succinyl-diaminopimelate desuccinylase-like protein